MKKIIIIITSIALISLNAFAQKHNTGLKEIKIGDEINRFYKNIPSLELNRKNRADQSEVKVIDNSKNKYFPPVVSQIGGSCAYASGVAYIFNYEYNRLMDKPSNTTSNLFDYLYIWALQNDGVDQGGFIHEVWDAVKANGVATKKVYSTTRKFEWMNGAEKYINGMEHRVKSYRKIDLFPSGLYSTYSKKAFQDMKDYLLDAGDGVGGLIQFSAFADPLEASSYSGKSLSGYRAIIPKFGVAGMHSMTIVGFDDDVEWDYDHNGTISDDEKGAFICINSWGATWGDNGRFYAPYKTFIGLQQGHGGTGNGGKECFVLVPEQKQVTHVLKVMLKHTSRNDIKFIAGVSRDSKDVSPQELKEISIMNGAGGDHHMRGTGESGDETIELAFDISDLAEFGTVKKDPKFFLEIRDKQKKSAGKGEIIFCSLIDYRNGEQEFLGKITQAKLQNGTSAKVEIETVKPDMGEGLNSITNYFMNSSKNELNVYFNCIKSAYAEIDILDESGKVYKNIYSKDIAAGSSKETINLNSIPAGDYLVRIIADNQVIYEKINIE